MDIPQEITETIVRDGLPNKVYHSHPALSKSSLDELSRSPLHYWRKYLDTNKPNIVWSDAFTVGAALHALVLEPHKYDEEFITMPKVDKRTKAGKEELAAFEETKGDKILVTEEQKLLCDRMVSAIEGHEEASKYLDGFGVAERSIFWNQDGVSCRCRPDYIREDGMMVDVKTARSADPDVFTRKAFDLRYHVQAGWYSLGYQAATGKMPKGFVFVVVEKTDPYPVSVMVASQDFIRAGVVDALDDLKKFKRCKVANDWQSYNFGKPAELDLPYYVKNKYEGLL